MSPNPPSAEGSGTTETPTAPRTAAVILAAGLGTRMKSRLPKVLHPLSGRPMLAYTIDAAREATGERPIVVYSPATAAVCEVFADAADFALQDEPRGTADALRAGLAAVSDATEEIVAVNADAPLLGAETVRRLIERRRITGSVMAMTWTESDPRRYGRVVLSDDGGVERIVEHKDASDDERAIRRWNVGLYAFDAAWLRSALTRLEPSGSTGEVYLTALVALARSDGLHVAGVHEPDAERFEGLDDRAQLAGAERRLRDAINHRHMLAGVTMHDPATAYVDEGVEIAADVTLEPNVVLRGRTRIGDGTLIRSGSQIFDSTIGRDCTIWASVIEGSQVDDEVEIGPFAHVRPGSSIERGARLGNFAEVKKSRIGARTQQHHFSYIGDADVGEGVNIAAGTITANYNGVSKLPTRIGDGAFIGVDTMLVAPVEVGEGAYTGAGAVVTKNVPPGKLAVGVPARIRERRRTAAPTPADAPTEAAGSTTDGDPER